MSHNLHTYGSQDPIYFALVDSNGASVTGHTFVATDVYLVVDGSANVDVSAHCIELTDGFYKWTPNIPAHTQYEVILIAITDSGGSTFVDNKLIIQTGGHVDARFSG